MACCRGCAYSSVLSVTAPGPRSLGVQHDNAISEKYIPRLPKPLVYYIINPYRAFSYTINSCGTTFCGTISCRITYRVLAYEITYHRMASYGIILYRLRLTIEWPFQIHLKYCILCTQIIIRTLVGG